MSGGILVVVPMLGSGVMRWIPDGSKKTVRQRVLLEAARRYTSHGHK